MASVVSALFQKKSAELSDGYYSRGAEVRPPNRSKYNTRPADVSCALGMGIVQALLAALAGHVEWFSWREKGQEGTAHLSSTSSSSNYDFTWDERDPLPGLYGGFSRGPTYQLAILHLILCYLDLYHGGSERSTEVMQAWFKLVEAMKRFYPDSFDPECGWRKKDVASACRQGDLRALIEHAADAMWFTMRYRLPDLMLDRCLTVYPSHVIALPLELPEGTLQGSVLLKPPGAVDSNWRVVKARRVRQELELALDPATLQGLSSQSEREKRIVTALPVWHFPDPFEEGV
jgi:hypothetical protein